jgi:hypothetical protein
MQVPAGFNESCDLFFVSVCALRGEEGFGQPSLVPEPPSPELGGKGQHQQKPRDRNGSLPPTFSVYRAIAERDVNPSAFSPTLSFAATHQDHPPLLTPLLHALSLLHRAVTARRQAHYQPSTACVVSCVRSLLMSTECLHREGAQSHTWESRHTRLASTAVLKLAERRLGRGQGVGPDSYGAGGD